MKIDINKKYRTRDGRPVVIHAMNGPNEKRPIIGIIYNDNGDYWSPFDCPESGEYGDPKHGVSPLDLIEVREPREWKATVRNATGEIYAYDLGDEDSNNYEVIRVREILD